MCCELCSLSASIDEDRAPLELLLGAPPTVHTTTAGCATPYLCCWPLRGMFAQECLHSAFIVCLHDSLPTSVTVSYTLDLAPLDTNEQTLQPSVVSCFEMSDLST